MRLWAAAREDRQMPVYAYDPPDRFVAGTVGQPGQRAFYLQATATGRVTSVALEKGQVSQLAERLDELLDEVLRRTGGSARIPAVAPEALSDDEPLEQPLMEDFRVGAIALAWDGESERVIIEAQELSDEPIEPLTEELPDDGPAILRVTITAAALEVAGRLVEASNATLYCTVTLKGQEAACVYKPVAGERPLWDFPHGTLAGRELAAYAVSRASGWDIVPPTVYRDGPFGPGMCQLWIDPDPSVDLIALARSGSHHRLRAMSVFDAVINNADRKSGHLLPAPGGHLYGCDHGVCFAEEYKLRTVLWQWRGKSLPGRSVAALEHLAVELSGGALE